MEKQRLMGVCNCPFRSGWGVAVCILDGAKCKIKIDDKGIWCRGWLPDGLTQGQLFMGL